MNKKLKETKQNIFHILMGREAYQGGTVFVILQRLHIQELPPSTQLTKALM